MPWRSRIRIPVDSVYLPSSRVERCAGSNPRPEGVVMEIQHAAVMGCGRCGRTFPTVWGRRDDGETVCYVEEHERFKPIDYQTLLYNLMDGVYREGWSLAAVKHFLEARLPVDTFYHRPKKP